MTAQAPVVREHGNAYNIFILVLTVYSLAMMVLLILPLDDDTHALVNVYDNAICVIFLIDFAMNLAGAQPKRAYFIGRRGWLDLIGSIPSLGFFRFTALLRLARLSRLTRITRLLRVRQARISSSTCSRTAAPTRRSSRSCWPGWCSRPPASSSSRRRVARPGPTSTTGGDALWWGIVTITTVGYGDYYPVTTLGRITAVFVMFAGIGIIGALASILASLLVSPAPPSEEEPEEATVLGAQAAPPSTDAIVAELASLRAEIAGQRSEIAALRATLGPGET